MRGLLHGEQEKRSRSESEACLDGFPRRASLFCPRSVVWPVRLYSGTRVSGNVSGAEPPLSGNEILRRHILGAVHDAQHHDAVVVGAKIDAPLPVREAAQPFHDVVPGRAGKIDFGNPGDLSGEVGQELLGVIGATLGDVTPDAPQIRKRERGDDETLRADGFSPRLQL